MIQRSGEVILRMLSDVKQITIKPLISSFVQKGSLIYADEYAIYNRLEEWGYSHKSVNHGKGARLC